MNTWWIIKLAGRLLIVIHNHSHFIRSSIGPYWTKVEAEQMIKKWR